jgi:hypothetical protein
MKRRSFPPYGLLEDRVAQGAERRLERLERLYHVGQSSAWDGRAVLEQLIARHGKPTLAPTKRDAALPILSVLLWGELAAWAISADLAERIDDVEAKMAATSQAHDEARHFYVLRDYLQTLGQPVPHLGGVGRRLLCNILETDSLVHKLIGMQLLVESNALAIFRALVEANVEPVLGELLPYYEKDEARHVGLGVLYLPRLVEQLSATERAAAVAFQLRCVAMLITAGFPMRKHFHALGIDPRRMAQRTMKLQDEALGEMRRSRAPGAARQPLGVLLSPARGVGPRILDFVHPPGGIEKVTPLHRLALRAWSAAASAADRALA